MADDQQKKRKFSENQSEEEEEVLPSKSKKIMTAKELREKIKSSDGLTAVKLYFTTETDHALIEDYIKEGGSLPELISLLSDIDLKKNMSHAMIVFLAMHHVIMKTITDFPDQYNNLVNECKKFIGSYLTTLLNVLKSANPVGQKRTTIRLLTALASVSEPLGREILTTFDLTQVEVNNLAEIYKPDDRKSLRTAFINFLLAFIIERPTSLIQKLIYKKGLLISVFANLKYDVFTTAEMLLSSLHKHIVSNKDITKTQRLLVFNSHVLGNMLNAYSWDPYAFGRDEGKGKQIKDVIIQEVNPEERNIIRKVLHQLFMTLCSSNKFGVIFHDPTYGTTAKQCNHLMYTMMQSIGQPWEDPLKEELAITVLQNCPDLIRPTIPLFASYFESSNKFVKVTKFFCKIIEGVEVNIEELDPKSCIKVAHGIFVPFIFVKFVSDAEHLIKGDEETRLTALHALQLVLGKLAEFTKGCEHKVDSSYNSSLMQYLINNLSNGSVLLDSLDVWCKDEESSCVEYGLLETIRTLLLYNLICPQLLDSIRFNKEAATKIELLVKGIVGNKEARQDTHMQLVIKAIQLGMVINPQDPTKKEFQDQLRELCKLVAEDGSIEVLNEILESTGYLEASPHELALWMHLLNFHPSASELFPPAIALASEDMAHFVKMLMSAEEATTSVQDEQLALDHIDLDDFINLAEEDRDNILDVVLYSGMNVSPLLPAILQVIDNMDSEVDKEKTNYVTKVLVHMFHYQVSPQAFVCLLRNFKCEAVKTVLPYMETWDQSASILSIPVFKGEDHTYISKCLLEEGFEGEPLLKLESKQSSTVSGELCFRQVLFYICQLSKMNMATASVVKTALSLIQSLVENDPSLARSALGHPHLLRDFHPVRKSKNSNLRDIIIYLTSHIKPNDKILAPYIQRFLFELKFTINKKSVPKSKNMEAILKSIPIFEEDVKPLLVSVSQLDSSLLLKGSSPTGWMVLELYLLKRCIEHKIFLSNEELSDLCKQVTDLCRAKVDLEDLLRCLLDYFKRYESPDFYGEINNTLRELLQVLCEGECWYEDLARWLVDVVGEGGGLRWQEIQVERALPLASSSPSPAALLTIHSRQISHAIFSLPTPVWLTHIPQLVEPYVAIEECEKISQEINRQEDQVVISQNNLNLLFLIFKKASLMMLLSNLIQDWLLRALKEGNQMKSEELSTVLAKCLENLENKESLQKASTELTKLLLSRGLKIPSPVFLKVLTNFVRLEHTELTSEMLFQLVAGHSCFLGVILSSNDSKYELLLLLSELVKKDESIMKSSHIPVYLAAYNASLSRNDQTILKLLQLYDSKGKCMTDWKPCIWGEPAVDHYCIKDRPALVEATNSRTIQLLDLNMVNNTIANFPINRGFEDEEMFEEFSDVYDPAFMLPLLSQALSPGSEVAGARMVAQSGALALALASLSSAHPRVRLAGYHIIHRHQSSLTETKDNLIWIHFLEAFQNGLGSLGDEKNKRLSSIVTTFLARTSIIMTEPPHVMYKALQNFILVKPTMNLNTVPAFLELFNSTDAKRKAHQHFILEIIRDGLRETADLQLALNCFVFKFILDFHTCSIATQDVKNLIEEIVEKCIMSVDIKKHLLLNEYSLLPWLSYSIKSPELMDKISPQISKIHKPFVNHMKIKVENLAREVKSVSLN